MKSLKWVSTLTTLFFLQIPSLYASVNEWQIANLFKEYPQNQTVVLSDHSSVAIPIYYPQVEGLVVSGLIPLENARELMKDTGIYPAAITSKYAYAAVFMNNADSSLGKYQEFMVLVAATANQSLAQPTSSNVALMRLKMLESLLPTMGDRHARDQEEFFYYLPWITTTSDSALLVGREFLNMPKYKGTFNLNFSGSKKSGLMESEKCNIQFGLSHPSKGLPMPLYMDINYVGFWKESAASTVRVPFLAKGTQHVYSFDEKKGDYFYADPKSDCGKWFEAANFKPLLWQYVARAGGVLLAPEPLSIASKTTMTDLPEFSEANENQNPEAEFNSLMESIYRGYNSL